MTVDMKEKVDQWFKAWNLRNPERITQLYSDDCLFEQVGGMGTICHNKTELTSYIKEMFNATPDLKLESKTAYFSGDNVCGEIVMSGSQMKNRNPSVPNVGPFSMRGAYISAWKDGKIKRHSYYQDYSVFMQLVGGPSGKK
jgi:steroid delta-isomerase-like uncharacterized protein